MRLKYVFSLGLLSLKESACGSAAYLRIKQMNPLLLGSNSHNLSPSLSHA